MKKVLTFGLAGIAALCLTVSPAFACDKTDGASKASAQTTGSCTKEANAKMVSAGGTCTGKGASASLTSADKATCAAHASGKMTTEECAKMMGMTAEECAKMCGDGKMQMVNMNVKGMTCGGCEKSVTAALQKVDGVMKVVSVSHADGTALVCIDPTKVKPEALTIAVTNTGFEAQVIPAVATTTSATGKTCAASAEGKACCAAKGAKAQTTGAEGTK